MGYDDRREIFERLEQLERMARSRRGERRGRDGWDERGRGDDGRRRGGRDRDGDRDRDEGRGGGNYDEKRVIDTIVHLVVENLDRHLEDRQARAANRDGGDEKRFVDLIVGLVSEHVREIVASELDRRLSPAPGGDDAAEACEED